MTTQKLSQGLADEHYERAASLANVILEQTRYKGFAPDDLYIALKMCNIRLERDFKLKVSRWDENAIDYHLSRCYLP